MSIIPDYSKSCAYPLNHDELEKLQNLGYKVEETLPKVAKTSHYWAPIDTEEGKKYLDMREFTEITPLDQGAQKNAALVRAWLENQQPIEEETSQSSGTSSDEPVLIYRTGWPTSLGESLYLSLLSSEY